MARRKPSPRFHIGLRLLGKDMCRIGPDPPEPPAPAMTVLDLWRDYPAESRYTGGRYRLRAARKAMRLSQSELATKVGLRHQSLVSWLESGMVDCPDDVWRRLEAELGVPEAELRRLDPPGRA